MTNISAGVCKNLEDQAIKVFLPEGILVLEVEIYLKGYFQDSAGVQGDSQEIMVSITIPFSRLDIAITEKISSLGPT